ncbi:MAG: bifunctional (p)ppGpp synthetase/guanosine-3',5'-bis(diphosphate) 3'-pyrophosphohydrolase [Limnochordaceae bacterium]|nr:bifunctional (p)ppGpp synthetase/guanosine-3',5'-bis(diphosphate) 3'-pyrophosphohydrolase [Limnochordaceae bacterium]
MQAASTGEGNRAILANARDENGDHTTPAPDTGVPLKDDSDPGGQVVPEEEIIAALQRYNPQAPVELVSRAYRFARQSHAGQRRDGTGVSYFQHPAAVAKILTELEMDASTVAAGLLHDVLEDTTVTRDQLQAEFGKEITRLVDGVTKLSKIPFQSREEHQAESLRKMFLAMAEDLRVIVIKLADRLHNMRTLEGLPPERQRKIARETLEIYAPIAHRLGMSQLKWELEDLAFRVLEPEAYHELVQMVAKKRKEREGEIAEAVATIRQRLQEMNLRAEVQGRPKHFYSIYQKMKQGRQFTEIYDLLAVRVIVDTVRDCYAVLGMVHSLWKPIPGRFKDYISIPKSNGYQSLHTTVVGPHGEPLEIQIRTWEMHRIAEKGIAAHWLYKEGYKTSLEFEEKVAWLRQVMEWLREMKDPHEFMETLKIDLFEDEVFCFTPKGDVKNLPAGSTPIDFSFAVHTDIGLHCVGAKVNGKLVPLNYVLQNGDFVEILTSKNASPTQDWLALVKTSKARSKIRAWLKEAHRAEAIEQGRTMLEREAKRLSFDPKEVLKVEKLADVSRSYGLAGPDDLLAAVGFGRLTVMLVLGRLVGPEQLEAHRQAIKLASRRRHLLGEPGGVDGAGAAPAGGASGGTVGAAGGVTTTGSDGTATGRLPHANVVPLTGRASEAESRSVDIEGVSNLLVRFARCCNPVPGDPIVGYVTRGRGVSIHRQDCLILKDVPDSDVRRVPVHWRAGELPASFPVAIEVEAIDRVNLLANVLNAVAECQTNIEAVQAHSNKSHYAYVNLVVDIRDVSHLQLVLDRIRRVQGVLTVSRSAVASAR